MAFHFPVMPRLFMALARGDPAPVIDILKATPPIPPGTQWCTFLRNHDELTLEMVTEAERQWMWDTYAPEPRMRLNLGIRRRLAPLLDGDRRKIELAHALLFALPGAPILYSGDEIGMGDNIWLDDRDGVRTPMQWDDSPNAGFSSALPEALYAPVIDDGPFSFQRVNVAAARADPGSLWHALRRLASTRKAIAAFGWGDLDFLPVYNRAVLGVARRYPGAARERRAGDDGRRELIVALHNLSNGPQTVQVDLSALPALDPAWVGRPACDVFAGDSDGGLLAHPYQITLAPYGYAWLRVLAPGGDKETADAP
jgi:maltose alpha-D-glucosyltransferase/alpha-amylase